MPRLSMILGDAGPIHGNWLTMSRANGKKMVALSKIMVALSLTSV
jgi:hypothetical protein